MSTERIRKIAEKLQLLDRKMDILTVTVGEAFKTSESRLELARDISAENIHTEFSNWKQDLLIKYYDPRSRT